LVATVFPNFPPTKLEAVVTATYLTIQTATAAAPAPDDISNPTSTASYTYPAIVPIGPGIQPNV
jgi:hypothetical protein